MTKRNYIGGPYTLPPIDAIALADELERIAGPVEWRVGSQRAKTYIARFPEQQAAIKLAGDLGERYEVYRYQHRSHGAEQILAAAEVIRSQHSMLQSRQTSPAASKQASLF